uniref:Uncharacterized protein n=1 Tax=Glossina palpalis gambiensis TaxID=67801 RepID=A0A1B0B119_9MUSC
MPDDLTVNSKELRDNNATTNECSVNALIKSLICPPCNVNERKRISLLGLVTATLYAFIREKYDNLPRTWLTTLFTISILLNF